MLSASLKNISGERVIINCESPYYDYNVDVVDARKKTAQPTDFLRYLQKEAITSTGSYRGIRLDPGCSAECNLNVARFFDMTTSGKYCVTLRRGMPFPLFYQAPTGVVSNTAEVTIVEPGAQYTVLWPKT